MSAGPMDVDISLNLGDFVNTPSQADTDTRILELKDRVKELEEALRLEVRAHADARSHLEEALRLEVCAHADALRTRPQLSELEVVIFLQLAVVPSKLKGTAVL